MQRLLVRLVYQVTPRQRLIVVDGAVMQMMAFAQSHPWQAEAGGVLMGRHLIDSHDIVVDEVTTPQTSDIRSRFGFFRSKKHESVARDRWLQESGALAYLGLWHTHPEEDPMPSSVDRADWEKAVLVDKFDGDRLFFPIIGTTHIRMWTLSRRGTFKKLKEVSHHG